MSYVGVGSAEVHIKCIYKRLGNLIEYDLLYIVFLRYVYSVRRLL